MNSPGWGRLGRGLLGDSGVFNFSSSALAKARKPSEEKSDYRIPKLHYGFFRQNSNTQSQIFRVVCSGGMTLRKSLFGNSSRR